MRITITESQYKNIIIENRNSSIENELKESDSFFKNLVKSAKQQLNLDLTFLVTWGATIGGFMHPISEFIKNGQMEISNQDLSLITIGCVLTYFTDIKKMLFEVLEKIVVSDDLIAKLLEENEDEEFKNIIAALSVEDFKAIVDKKYVDSIFARLLELSTSRTIADLKSQLQRLEPETNSKDHDKMFQDLLELEEYRRALREKALGTS